jgi:hypothetical protein
MTNISKNKTVPQCVQTDVSSSVLDYSFIKGKSFLFIFKKDKKLKEVAFKMLSILYPMWKEDFINQKLKENYSFNIDRNGNCGFNKDLYYTNWWGRDYTWWITIENNSFSQTQISKLKPIKPFPYWFVF